MAVAIPLLSIAGGVTAGLGVAAGAAVTFGSFLSMAGGMASALGLLSKDKDLAKLGGVLSLAGGVSSMVSNAANAAGTAAPATADAMDTAAAMTKGAEGAETLLTAPGASSAAPMPTMGTLAGGAADTAGTGMLTGIDAAGNVVSPMGGGLGTPGPSIADSLMGRAQANVLTGGGAPVTAGAPPMTDFLADAAKGMTSGDVAGAAKSLQTQVGSLWDRAKGLGTGALDFIKQNPMATALVSQGISGTMAARQQQEALDYQKSLIERARRNLNSPVGMSFTPGG